MKKGWLLVGAVVVLGVVGAVVARYSCVTRNSLTTHTSSGQFSSSRAKLEFLEKYAKLDSVIIDAEYRIDYQDNAQGWIPGPSDWDMRLAVKIPPGEVQQWLQGFDKVEAQEVELSWWAELPLQTKTWERNAQPVFYRRPDQSAYLAVFAAEGIILKRIVSR